VPSVHQCGTAKNLKFPPISVISLILWTRCPQYQHRYLMSRLSLQVMWHHLLSTVPPFILWWSNLEILFAPLHLSSPFIGGLRCQAIQMEHGPYIAERTQKAVYIVRCLWVSVKTRAVQCSQSLFYVNAMQSPCINAQNEDVAT
jgi:hypothetical protein